MENESLNHIAQQVRRRRNANNPEQQTRGRQENGEIPRAVMEERAQYQAPTNKFAEFNRLAPPQFEGNGDPLEAKKWVSKLEKLFNVLDCSDEERVRFAVFQLQGNAEDWWEMEMLTHVHDVTTFSWEAFKEVFYDNYFPKSLWQEKETEFLELKQGTMTVTEYQARFVELAKFGRTLIGSEIAKVRKFEMGLSPHIKPFVIPSRITSFVEVVERARLVERELGPIKKMEDTNSRKRSYQNVAESSHNSFRGKRHFQSNMTPVSRSIPSQNQFRQCSHCFKNHRTEDCRWLSGACFICGQHGHKRINCPQFRRPIAPPNVREVGSSVNQRSMLNPSRKMGQPSGGQARVFSTMNTEQARASNAVVSEKDS